MVAKQNIIFSGVQPTGNLHIGNYLGAIRNFVKLQDNYPHSTAYYCVVDLHAITVWKEPNSLKEDILETVATFIAAGIDPKKSIIFNQSKISCHAEIAWILNCICRIGWLNRMTQFKEKAGKNKENVSVGLYTYPVLMAADILTYRANLVPVGEDQKQHLELARDIVQKFNNDYKTKFFPDIKPLILEESKRIMSLRDGQKKMSKSDISDYSRINILDKKDVIIKKIRKAKTDAEEIMGVEVLNDQNRILPEIMQKRPEAINLLHIYSSLNGKPIKSSLEEFEGKTFSFLKEKLSDVIVESIVPLGDEVRKMLQNKEYMFDILDKGAEIANKEAQTNLKELKDIIGLL